MHLKIIELQVFGALQLQLLYVSLLTPPNDAQVTQVLVADDHMLLSLQEHAVLDAFAIPLVILAQLIHSPATLTLAAAH